MAKFLKTTGVSYHLEQLIMNANERLIIISPFLKINDRIKELLDERNLYKIDIRIIFGKNALQPEENNWLKSLDFVRTSFCKNLHAKCYLNENEAIITSMNLYEFSQVNNNEMGVLISKEEDSDLYKATFSEAQRLIRISDEIKVSVEKISSEKVSSFNKKTPSKEKTPSKFYSKKQPTNYNKKQSGFCIRCKAPLNLNPMVPFCRDCFSSWKKFGNEEYQEKYCHICGESNKTSKLKPSCYTCYKKNSKVLDFPI
ncbi:hypothetical protein BMS3Abin16_01727 [archaeon BMS3Abin16]|nr:hypothetical protein BMS3Abin16_01727 [archaeon BMS3Abin16]HDY74565.1 hypothetical protein [Euryarchaeota archaeon]